MNIAIQIAVNGGGLATPVVPPPTDPAAGYSAWFEASELVYQDAAGTTPATADNDPVMRWDSKGGTYGALVCTTPGGYGACSLQSFALSGKPCVRALAAASALMKDVTDTASIPGALLAAVGCTVMAVVYRPSSEPGAAGVWGANDNGMTCAYDSAGGAYGLRNYLNDGGFKIAPVKPAPSGTPHILTFHHSGGQLYSGVDDSRDASMSSIAAGSVVGAGAFLVLLGYSGPGGYVDGDVAEILFYHSALSQDDRIVSERYLAAKYGVALGYL